MKLGLKEDRDALDYMVRRANRRIMDAKVSCSTLTSVEKALELKEDTLKRLERARQTVVAFLAKEPGVVAEKVSGEKVRITPRLSGC